MNTSTTIRVKPKDNLNSNNLMSTPTPTPTSSRTPPHSHSESMSTSSATSSSTSAVLNTISPPFPLGSSFGESRETSMSQLLDLARKTPLPTSTTTSPLKLPSVSAATNALRATWATRLSASTDPLLLAIDDSGHSRSHSTSPTPNTRSPGRTTIVQFQIQDDSLMPPAALPSRLGTASPSRKAGGAGLAALPTASAAPVTTNPLKPGRIVHRSLSPTPPPAKSKSPIRPLSHARVPKGRPTPLVRAFDTCTQSLLFLLGVIFLAMDFFLAPLWRLLGVVKTPSTSTSPRRYLHAKLTQVALWPPLGTHLWIRGLDAMQARLGTHVGRVVFFTTLVTLGPSYAAFVVGVSVPLALVKALTHREAARTAKRPSDDTREARGRKAERA